MPSTWVGSTLKNSSDNTFSKKEKFVDKYAKKPIPYKTMKVLPKEDNTFSKKEKFVDKEAKDIKPYKTMKVLPKEDKSSPKVKPSNWMTFYV